jgi:nicotinate-nucleotide adenylyltransferase
MAREAVRRFELDRVLLVPASTPPHKAGATITSYADRYRMVELACAGQPRLEASRLEEGSERSYSIHTIEKVRATLKPGDRLFFLIGSDAFAEIRTWLRWRDVVANVEFIVVSRPGSHYAIPEEACVHRLETLDLPVSSSEVRRKLARGEGPAEVPKAVLAYICEHGLYRNV